MDTLFLSDPRCLAHDPGPGHPESRSRLEPLLHELAAGELPGLRQALPTPSPRPALLRIHEESHVRCVEQTAGRAHTALDPDTHACADTQDAALLAAGAAIDATEAVIDGHANGAFALVRPPGHHAEPDRPMGFCFYNNVAVAAAHAAAEADLSRILILDPDVHHGNGTQSAFWTRSNVLYVSSHRSPFYPGTGAPQEIGRGEGEGFTVNMPLSAGMGDAEILALYREIVGPIVEEWKPELILISAGFDTWHGDPLGGLKVTERGYEQLFGLFASWSSRHCPKRLAYILEGGYDPAGVSAGTRAAVATMQGQIESVTPERESLLPPQLEATVSTLTDLLSPHWPSLRRK